MASKAKPRALELKPSVRRRDFLCTDCGKLTSIYIRRGDRKPQTVYCGWCGDCIAIQEYNPRKHGCISGNYNHWSTSQTKLLETLLQERLSWRAIATKLGRGVNGVRMHAERMGLEKKFNLAGRVPKAQEPMSGDVKLNL